MTDVVMAFAREMWWPHHESRTRDVALAALDAGAVGKVTVEFEDIVNIVSAAMGQAGEPVAGEMGDIQRFHKSYICLGADDDGEEYVRWSDVLAALPTLQRLGQEFDAGEVTKADRDLYARIAPDLCALIHSGDLDNFGEMQAIVRYRLAHMPQSRVAAEPVGLREEEDQ